MRKKIGILFSVSALILAVSAGCLRPTDIRFSNVHCTEANLETDVDAQVKSDALNIKVCIQCAGTPAEGASVEGHVVKTESFDPPESIGGHIIFAETSSTDNGCTTKDIAISGMQPGDLVGQKFELTVKDIDGKVANTGKWVIRSAQSN